jgi:transposase
MEPPFKNPLDFLDGIQWPVPFSKEDWEKTPEAVRAYIPWLHRRIDAQDETIHRLSQRIDELESRTKRNSSNSNQPPSSDSPYKKKPKDKPKGKKPGGKKGHKGHRQELLKPSQIEPLKPESCSCGNTDFPETQPYYTHQYIELPEIQMEVIHFVLHRGQCPCCGKTAKATLPNAYRTGYGPRLSASVAQLAGGQGDSRSLTREFCASVLGISISLGAIQKIIDRVSAAITPHYEAIGEAARSSEVNHIDETSYSKKNVLQWLWVMTNTMVAFFMIHPNRSKEAFKALIGDWVGILVSDGYGLYRKWIGLRQTCLAHLIRKAREISEKTDPELARFGKWALSELQRLCHMAEVRPTPGQWRAFYARFIRLITLNRNRKDATGRLARHLERELACLWLFLEKEGVAPTNNHAERILRFGVLWRKRSQGTASEKGNRWVERILSVRQTCRLKSRPLFPTLVDALQHDVNGTQPDRAGIQA